ncbi:exonuclease family member protein [Theileria equi strain WA]|uniref:Exonuclease family member protein n=1 Tax=Theileria equi strain WA TaxID=1537102 RepID=L0AUX8_THEEQ|nr:exonuclease family member protein [Theileria equi strain WA]AFZ79345.1 exonuclease family member protein [Theileria equi strain WA]|eukprot:XP_004829011.1 exonuclease family member protein [Theileria equi strain WA]
MQYGLLKYDEWNHLIWLYNSIHSPLKTALTGSLIGVSPEDDSVKYTHFFSDNHNPHYLPKNDFNQYCGCYNHSVNALEVFEKHLLVSKNDEIIVIPKAGQRNLSLLNYETQHRITNGGLQHITASLLSSTSTSSTIVLSSFYDELFFVDAFVGELDGAMNVTDTSILSGCKSDKVTVLSDFSGSSSTSYCPLSYYLEANEQYTNNSYSEDSYTLSSKENNLVKRDSKSVDSKTSLKSIAEKYGSMDKIPEFVPSTYSTSSIATSFEPLNTAKTSNSLISVEKTIGALSLECAMNELRQSDFVHNASRDVICVGMASGLVHLVDKRINKIVSSINSHKSSVYTIAASGNTIATTGCLLYGNSLLYEPIVHIHDLRMNTSRVMWLESAVSKVSIAPKSDRLFALMPDGNIFDCKLSTMEYSKIRNDKHTKWQYYDIEAVVPKNGKFCEIYTSNAAFSTNKVIVDNEVTDYLNYDQSELPKKFQKIPHSKSISFNKTPFASVVGTFSGDIVHIYVQIFFFLPILKSLRCHICEVGHCITCQIGFALHMLQVAHENRTKEGFFDGSDEIERYSLSKLNDVFQVTQLQELMIVDDKEMTPQTVLKHLIWIIEKMNTELENFYGTKHGYQQNAGLIKDVFGFSKKIVRVCENGHTNTRISSNEFYVKYEQLDNEEGVSEKSTFYCAQCSMVNMKSSITIHTNPNLLIVDCTTEGSKKIKNLKKDIKLNGEKYSIHTAVFSVPSEEAPLRPLAYVKVPQIYETKHQWMLINDGVIMYLDDKDEVFDYTHGWKNLILAIYTKQEMGTVRPIEPVLLGEQTIVPIKGRLVPLPLPSEDKPISSSIFVSESNMAHNPAAHGKTPTFVPLSLEELFEIHNSEFFVALDVECVKSNNESKQNRFNSIESSSLDTSAEDEKTLYTLARVTAIRGNDYLSGVPFLDHYVLKRKPPKDYMTRFSGIHSGDLDLKSSVHWLTTEKSIYLKIRYLVDAGCKIIGHGLVQDFKVLNIAVPSDNVIDTVELFRIKGKRYISLQFLSLNLLDKKIQDKEHDSIEDAKAALELYRTYLYYKGVNELENVVRRLYDIGYTTNWLVN